MYCPYCKSKNTKVLDKRDYNESPITRRRRECIDCRKRFTTYERIDELSILVVKKDGSLQNFDENKIRRGIEIAGDKRISAQVIDKIVEEIKIKILNRKSNKVAASDIGRMVLTRLKNTDAVAYMRFASVFLDFSGLDEFKSEIKKIDKNTTNQLHRS